MPTPAYSDDFDSTSPAGSDSPSQFVTDVQTQLRSLRDMACAGRVKGFVYSRTTGTGPGADRPQYHTWLSSALSLGFRLAVTYGGSGSWQLSTVQWEWSNDNGATWASMGSAAALTYDGSNNVTASTNQGGFLILLFELWTKAAKVVSDLAAHVALTGTSAHGLGSVSTQSASAVALTGGTADDVAVGQTVPDLLDVLRAREVWVELGAIPDAGTAACNLAAGGGFSLTPSSTTSHTLTVAFTNPPAALRLQSFYLEIINGRRSADAKITWPANAKWITGSSARPLDTALELAGRNLFVVYVRDGGTRYEISHVGKGG